MSLSEAFPLTEEMKYNCKNCIKLRNNIKFCIPCLWTRSKLATRYDAIATRVDEIIKEKEDESNVENEMANYMNGHLGSSNSLLDKNFKIC